MISPIGFRRLAGVTALFTFLQITAGTTVRVSGSGLGCPDWPLCDGRPYPPLNIHSIVEISHRYLGTITGILLIATVVAAWIVYRRERRGVAWLATCSLLAIAAEGLLGGAVVIKQLQPWLVTAHLTVALTILGLLLATAIVAVPRRHGTVVPRGFRRLAIAAAALVFAVAVTGSSVVASQADEVCKSWPLCGGGLQPDFSGLNAFDMLHRLLAAATGLLVVYVGVTALRRFRGVPGLARAAALTLTFLCLQGFVLGPGAAITQSNPYWDGLHVAAASLVWAGALAVALLAVGSPSPREAQPAAALALPEALSA